MENGTQQPESLRPIFSEVGDGSSHQAERVQLSEVQSAATPEITDHPKLRSAISAHQANLRPLLIFGHDIAFFSGGEAALGREAKLIERHIFRRFFNAGFDGVLVFKFRELAGDETKDNGLVLDEAQRLERTRTVAVVLEEEPVHIAVREENICHGFVARPTRTRSSGSCRGRYAS